MTTVHHLITASRVQGSPVFNPEGKRLGKIEDLMLDKKTGVASYALLGYDGFLGIGEQFYPVPWSALTYDPDRGGYISPITAEQLAGGPTTADPEAEAECEWQEQVHAYYGAYASPAGF